MFEFEVFKPGSYPQGNWPIEKVRQLVADYDAEFLEAPVTKDHAQDGSAFGWVSALRLAGDIVVAAIRDLHPELYQQYRFGEYRKRSIEVHPSLPETGRPYLAAVTFLGAKTPSVRGLKDAQFGNRGMKLFFEYAEQHEFMRRAEQYASEHDCKLGDAMSHIVKTRPKLHQDYLNWHNRRFGAARRE